MTQTLKSSHWGHVGRNIEVIWQSRIGERSVTEQTAIHNTHHQPSVGEHNVFIKMCVTSVKLLGCSKMLLLLFYIQDQCVLCRKVVVMHWLTPRGQGTWEKETTVSPTENFCATFLFLLRIVAVSRFFPPTF